MPDHRPLDALFRPAALIAVVLAGEALALILTLAPAQVTTWRLIQFGLASLAIQWTSLGTLCAIYLLRRPLSRSSSTAVAWTSLAVLLAMSLLVSLAAYTLDTSGDHAEKMSFVLRMLAIALIVGVFGLMTYQNYWRAQKLAVRAKQLELEALQARIQPHFLFNTLNTGAALVHARPDEAERLLLDLADLFRAALRDPELVPLGQELDLTRRYLEIESLRFGERLQVHWHLPETIPDARVPSLSLQPLAENAIRHGIERLRNGGAIDIHVRALPDRVEVVLANDLPDSPSDDQGHAIGLASSRERVHALTDGRGHVESLTERGRYVARMTLPLDRSSVTTSA
ncbi:sensor histidine kinase [Lysobacter sp. TY2-98]|uniref:sensor histidine kinase n=1 Tax=Lysobacter sp. TY2-98 TaxID=2290922 RepID=UPI000E1FCE43|nr:histidine kinase [Lysobacter sp. TY2-98]AXK71482.1 sensor histidine kinase [Lysobacter sp. TY2-98]